MAPPAPEEFRVVSLAPGAVVAVEVPEGRMVSPAPLDPEV
jgi:hypothetical protein